MQNTMELFLVCILMIGGYFFCLQMLMKRMKNRSALPGVAVVLLFLFLCVGAVLYLTAQMAGGMGQILFALLLLMSVVVLGALAKGMVSNFQKLNKGMLVLCLTYVLGILYITLFSRMGTVNTSIKMDVFGDLKEALQSGSAEPMRHVLMNIALFVPFGFLFSMVHPKKLRSSAYPILTGAMFSTMIETIQMVFRIGQCDIDDIIGNTLGTVIGFLIFCIIWRGSNERSDD